MKLWRKIKNQVSTILQRNTKEAELDEELQFHLDMEIEKNLRAGMSQPEARKAALIALGGTEQTKEECRDSWGLRVLTGLIRNVKSGAKLTMRHKGTSILSAAMLSFGIAISILGFSYSGIALTVFENLGLTFDERQVMLRWDNGKGIGGRLNTLEYQAFATESNTLQDLVAYRSTPAWINTPGKYDEGRSYAGIQTTPNLNQLASFPALIRGRFLSRTNNHNEQRPEIVISEELWTELFSQNEAAIGSTLMVNDQEHTVVGIAANTFSFPNNTDFWIQDNWDSFSEANRTRAHHLEIVGIKKPEFSLEQVQAELATIASRMIKAHPNSYETVKGLKLVTAWSMLKRASILFVLVIVISVFALLISSINVFNIIIARTASRSHELAVRCSLGAKRGQIMWLVIVDGLLLAGTGAFLGILSAIVAFRRIHSYLLSFPSLSWLHHLELSPNLVWVSAAAAILSGVCASLIPAWRASKIDAFAILKDDSKSSSSIYIGWLSKGIVITQIAITSVVLFLGLVFLVIIPDNWAQSTSIPYPTESVLTAKLSIVDSPRIREKTTEELQAFYNELNQKLKDVPGIHASALASGDGLNGRRVDIEIEGREDQPAVTVDLNLTTANFLEIYDTQALSGRMFNEFDTESHNLVCVVDTQFVSLHCPDNDPIGMRLQVPYGPEQSEWVRVVGVVADLNVPLPMQSNRGGILLPTFQAPDWSPLLVVRIDNAGDFKSHQAIHAALNDVAPGAIIKNGIYTIKERIEQGFATINGTLKAGALIGGSLLAMSLISLYSIINFTTSLRKKEFGIRMAIGSSPLGIARTICKPWILTIGIGLGVGYLFVLVVLSQILTMNQGDSIGQFTYFSLEIGKAYSWVCILIVACCAAGIGIPTRKAMRLDPMEVIRQE